MKLPQKKAYWLSIGFLFFTVHASYSQDQQIADSLAIVYKADKTRGLEHLELLRNLAFNEINDLQLALAYAEELIVLSKKQKNDLYLHRGYFQKGNKKRLLGELEEALAAYFKSLEAAKREKYSQGEGMVYSTIADVYSVSNNHVNAKLYYSKAIHTLRQSGESIALASTLANAGYEFYNTNTYDTAFSYFKESSKIFEKLDYPNGKAYSLGNIGMLYTKLGKHKQAEEIINEAILILEEVEDYPPICEYLISMADIYFAKGDLIRGKTYAQKSLDLALQYGLKEQIRDANLKLSELYEKIGDTKTSLQYYKNHITYRDSVNNLKSIQAMADLRTNFEVSQKQTEVDLLKEQRRNQQNQMIALAIILVLIIIILGALYWFYRAISREHKRSESLLLNILPAETAQELKKNGKVEAVKLDEVTVLFTDFVEFSKKAEHIEPEHLVRSIDFYFKGFDEITSKYGLEKIKTIGDAYMCASGLPTPNQAHARNVILAAREMVELVNQALQLEDGLNHFEIRIGIHSGPVVAGIVGIKKWQYDIWGDTVNIAARMESASQPGRINLSDTTYQQIKAEFPCEYRGEIEVKNRGALKMYFLS
ncbi:MAG: adenylate/guanylate cyclase domain-containing protein [Haliscomenobacter sp.]|uniref:adenylate/guanylate cyclase domain-containing protein n=1 Tax=Haliscomenobacter sp. TaxID=2717303 RepID=UPI0029BAFA23|nr:adenylate/guanylate cyclase domain-containing protein [Haliscomenobacter sp.]MDX2069733.1 adenylate/guanylate cyclase domain-containing protein [Haliscomenobacter sp.]